MGLSIVADVYEKYKLEQRLRTSDRRWHQLMQNAHVFVLELDREGNITYVNHFGIRALGYAKLTELLGKNWFDNFLAEAEAKTANDLFNRMLTKNKIYPYAKSKIVNKHGKELIVSWANFLTYTDDGEPVGGDERWQGFVR